MNAARIELALVLEHLGVPIDLGTFSKRFNIQKKIYLAQVVGCDLGYRFGWYLRGPYCTALTEDAFTLKDEVSEGDTEHNNFRLESKVTKALDKAKALWQEPKDYRGSCDEWLELLASLHYLRHIVYRPQGVKRDFDDAFALLVKAKPQFTSRKDQAKQAWKRLDEFGLVKTKTLN